MRSFEAVRDLSSCLHFSEGYFKILSEQGFNNSMLSSLSWMQTEGIYGIVAENDGNVTGGVILFIPRTVKEFPYKELVSNTSSSSPGFDISQPENTGELIALWHSASMAGWGLSYLLLKAGLALARKLQLKKVLYLSAEYNMRLVDKLGFQPEQENGMNVYFTFQESNLNTKVFLNYFSFDENTRAVQQREEIQELATIGTITRLETVLSKKLEVEYHI